MNVAKLLKSLGIPDNLSISKTIELLEEKNLDYLERIQHCGDEDRKKKLVETQKNIEKMIDTLSKGISVQGNRPEPAAEPQKPPQRKTVPQKPPQRKTVPMETLTQNTQAAPEDFNKNLADNNSATYARRELLAAAEKGSTDAMLQLSKCYESIGDLISAEEWAQKANSINTVIKFKGYRGDNLGQYMLKRDELQKESKYSRSMILFELDKLLGQALNKCDKQKEKIELLSSLYSSSVCGEEKAMLGKYLEEQRTTLKKQRVRKTKTAALRFVKLVLLIGVIFLIVNVFNIVKYGATGGRHGSVITRLNASGEARYPGGFFFSSLYGLSIQKLPRAESITIKKRITRVSLENGPKLQEINIREGAEIASFRLNNLPKLRRLDLSMLTSVSSVLELTDCPVLNELSLPVGAEIVKFDNIAVTNVDFRPLGVLGVIEIKNCTKLEELHLPETVRMNTLIENCPALKTLTIPERFSGFYTLEITGCDALERVYVAESYFEEAEVFFETNFDLPELQVIMIQEAG